MTEEKISNDEDWMLETIKDLRKWGYNKLADRLTLELASPETKEEDSS